MIKILKIFNIIILINFVFFIKGYSLNNAFLNQDIFTKVDTRKILNIDLDYISSDEAIKEITKILSKKAYVFSNKDNNKLIIKDEGEKLREYQEIIRALDVPKKQVLISVKIIKSNLSLKNQLGVKFNTNFIINAAYNIAKIADTNLLNIELSALEEEGLVETISNPKLITTNLKSATISQGQEIPYNETHVHGNQTVNFKKAELSLIVTPRIIKQNKILLNLNITNDSPDLSHINSHGVPLIDTQQMQTEVLVNNNETLVIGGIFNKQSNKMQNKLPGISNIPFLGRLFGKKESLETNSEVILFINTKIIY